MPSTRKQNLRSTTLEEIERWVEERGFEPYRAGQIAGWLYNRPLTEVADMHNLPVELKAALTQDFDARAAKVAVLRESGDGTRKFLAELADGKVVESVLIPREERITLCISSQVGCAMDCDFCATATLGLARNLEPGEIVSQVLIARAVAAPEPLTNYVFMGMGEPLANYDRLMRALDIMTARWGLGISPRRITVSTVGLVPQLERLARETSVNIAVSLSAARDELRDRLMPINRKYPLERLVAACETLDIPKRKRITLEYVMLDGINDTERDAHELIGLCRRLRVKVNLIPFNPYPGSDFRPTPWERIERFQERLLASNIHATVRKSRGSDIQAACGQLAAAGAP
jgi:23S rRNA (adenine2503-C2)-methyltransferase